MPTKEEAQALEDKKVRDALIIAELTIIYDAIRKNIRSLAMGVTDKADGDQQWFNSRNRANRFATKVNKDLRPDYLKRDAFSKERYAEEYRTSYFTAKFNVENRGLREGYKVNLPRYSKQQFQRALNDPLSKLANTAKLQTGRSLDIQQLYTTIVSGVEQGMSLPKINRELDINLGYRDSKGKWIDRSELRRGQQYRTRRILRTEINRMRSIAETDQWLNSQDIVPSKLQWLATLDDRTRRQSAQMDGQISNKKGEFRFPNGIVARQGKSGVARYEVNDRCDLLTLNPDFPPESRIERDPVTGKNKVVPYKDFKQYASEKGLVKNRYGEYLFGKPTKATPSAPNTRVKSVRPKTPTRRDTPQQRVITRPPTATKKPTTIKKPTPRVNQDIEKLRQKKTVYSMNISKNIADEFNVTLDTVLRVESEFIKKFPRRKLNIDQLRGLVVDDMTKK